MNEHGYPEQRQIVWEICAQFWVDTWYDDSQLEAFAERLAQCGFSVTELDYIARREVCGAFALFTLQVFFTAGMALPDWYYPEDDARAEVANWLCKPRILSYLNPCWLIGYKMALSFFDATWPDLRRRVETRLGDAL